MSTTAALAKRIPALRIRARALAAVRAFFDARGYFEVETPAAIPAPAAEEYIEAPRVEGGAFLRSSPELEMKCLLCAGAEKIYQIGPCFRMGERGRQHHPEFTMLEFYQAGADYRILLTLITDLIRYVAHAVNGSGIIQFRGQQIDLDAPWMVIPVREAFRQFAGADADALAEEESAFEMVLSEKVEPALPRDRACVLIDYPARFAAFARTKKDDPTLAERWELYIGGMELANTYSELIDPVIQRERFRTFAETRRKHGLTEYPEATDFLCSMDFGMPESSGSAIGFDRLVMLLAGADSIDDVSYPQVTP